MMLESKCKKITLKTLRKKLKLSQEAFGKRLGVSRESVSYWERGIKSPSFSLKQVKALNEMLKMAGLDIDDIDEKVAS